MTFQVKGREVCALVIAATACVALVPAPALAQDIADVEVAYNIKTPDPSDPKAKGAAPQIHATVIGAPDLPADKFVLVDKSAKPPVQIKAASKLASNQGPETLAVAIVMLGWEMWIGNDTYRAKNDPTRATGVLHAIQKAIDKVDLKAAGPKGSLGMVIAYADTATIRVPMGPLEKLTGAALGTQKDFKNTRGIELVKGIELALAELKKVTNPRKVLIVFTDGTDTNNDAAKTKLATLKKQAAVDRVQTFALIYKAADSEPANAITQMIPQAAMVASGEHMTAAMQGIVKRIADRQYLTFPGYTKGAKQGLAWDGKVHELAIRIEKDETEPQSVHLPKWQPSP